VKPYSSAICHEPYRPPFQRARFGSAAIAAIARPTKQGVSEPAKPNCFADGFVSATSRQFDSVAPK
jgi:hypothetical protein